MKHILVTIVLLIVAFPVVGQSTDFDPSVQEFISVSDDTFALRGVVVIDGTASPAAENQTVVVDGGRIAAVGPVGDVSIPDGATVYDLPGHTLIPGMVGLHNHTFYMTSKRSLQLNRSAPRLYLASGVTTIRTTGSNAPYSEINLNAAIAAGNEAGPDIFSTGPYMTGGSGMSTMTRLDGPEDARRVVRYWAEEGVTWFKAYTLISREELGAAIDEAHKLGVKVTAHLCSVTYQEAVALGIDNLEHGLFANTDYASNKVPDQCPPGFRTEFPDLDLDSPEVRKTFQMMIDNDVAMTSTLAVYEMYVPNRPPLEERVLDAMSPDVREEYLTTRSQIAAMGDQAPFTEAIFRKGQDYEYAFYKAGGLLASGVDPTGYGGALPGFGDQRNYELLREAGFTAEETVQIISANGAKVLDIFDEVGTITPGKRADLVLIDGDIVNMPAEIRNVVTVFKNGVGFDSASLIESVSGEVGVR